MASRSTIPTSAAPTARAACPGSSARGDVLVGSGVELYHYAPGAEFWHSTSGDHAAWIRIDGHAGSGRLRLRAIQPGASGRFDLYGDLLGPDLTPIVSFADSLVPGHLTDYASTASALVAGNHVGRDTCVDVDGILRLRCQEGAVGALWQKSSGGPTRDGRLHGVEVTAPGHDLVAAVATRSFFGSLRFHLIQDGVGLYARFGGASGSAPILTGAVALLLQSDPDLTADEARAALHAAARADASTGAVPNTDWGFGKLDVAAALDLLDADDDGIANGVDVCPFTPDPGQADTGGRGAASAPDGIGDACQCGDVNGDGRVTLTDAVTLTRSLLTPPTAVLARPALCDVNASGTCSLADAAVVRRGILSPPTATIAQGCAPARPR